MTLSTRVFHPIARCTMVYIRYYVDTNREENTFGYQWNNTTPPTVAELTLLCNETIATLGEKIRQQMCNNTHMVEVHARNMDTRLGNVATVSFGAGTVGGIVTSNKASLNCVGNLVTRTGRAGYSQHGSKRIGNMDAQSIDGNTILGTMMGRFASTALSVLAGRVSGRFQPAIPHIVPPPGVGTMDLITFCGMLDSDVDSQKTRLNNHGS